MYKNAVSKTISYHPCGTPKHKIIHYDNGFIEEQFFDEWAQPHREDNLPQFTRTLYGKIYTQLYKVHYKYHNEIGPAVIFYNQSTEEYENGYYLNDVVYTEKWQTDNWVDFCKHIKQLEVFK